MGQSSQIGEDVRWKGFQVVEVEDPYGRGGSRGGGRVKM